METLTKLYDKSLTNIKHYRPTQCQTRAGVEVWFLPMLDSGPRRGWVICTTPLFYPQERPGTYCTVGWVGLGASLGGCGKTHPTGFNSYSIQLMICYTN